MTTDRAAILEQHGVDLDALTEHGRTLGTALAALSHVYQQCPALALPLYGAVLKTIPPAVILHYVGPAGDMLR